MTDEQQHAIHGRLKINGCWELIHPKPKLVEKSFLFFRWTSEEYDPLEREEAVEIAEDRWCGGKGPYQDVIVLRNNHDPEGYHTLCATCVWINGKWACHAANTSWAYIY